MPKTPTTSLANSILKKLKPACKKIEIAGSIRRREKNPRDIDIVLIPKSIEKIESIMKKIGKRIEGGEHESTWKVKRIKVELYYTTPESFGAELLAYSSEKGSAIGLRIIAKKKGFHLNQYGLWKGGKVINSEYVDGKLIAGKTEKSIYKALSRPYKEPWER